MSLSYLLLGSNLGDSRYHLARARSFIEEKAGSILGQSDLYESAPWGFSAPQHFLNQALEIETTKKPLELLNILLDIEKEMGRERSDDGGYASRLIDIDILFYGNEILDHPKLSVPHPRIQERRFVLVPMVELNPGLVHPVLQASMAVLLENCSDKGKVSRLARNVSDGL